MIKSTVFIVITALFSLNCVAEELVDPTLPSIYPAVSSSTEITTIPTPQSSRSATKLILNSTIVAPSRKIAIINGVQLKIGDEVNGAIIRHISHQQVELVQQDGEIIILSLQKSFISDMKSAAP